jgi:hypothetical protein
MSVSPALADLHMEDVVALFRARVCFPHHVHDDERVDAAPLREGTRQGVGLRPLHANVMHGRWLALS